MSNCFAPNTTEIVGSRTFSYDSVNLGGSASVELWAKWDDNTQIMTDLLRMGGKPYPVNQGNNNTLYVNNVTTTFNNERSRSAGCIHNPCNTKVTVQYDTNDNHRFLFTEDWQPAADFLTYKPAALYWKDDGAKAAGAQKIGTIVTKASYTLKIQNLGKIPSWAKYGSSASAIGTINKDSVNIHTFDITCEKHTLMCESITPTVRRRPWLFNNKIKLCNVFDIEVKIQYRMNSWNKFYDINTATWKDLQYRETAGGSLQDFSLYEESGAIAEICDGDLSDKYSWCANDEPDELDIPC